MLDLDDGLLVALAGRYEIEREIGQGGMAIVYLARDVKLNRRVALKVLRPELANSLGTERFLQEISIAAPLVHPNILAIYESGEAAGHLYYVMPYVDGLTLRQRLDRELQLPIDETIAIVKQVAAALEYAHARGVVHRDIKPENILLLGEHVLVADFGLAKAISRATSHPLTQSGLVVGTPAYMSPEQATPGVALDARSDIYSLACVTFEMIAGMPPYRGATPQAVLAHHVASDPPMLCAERSSCPPHLDEAVRRAMAKVPADRFRSASEFARALSPPRPPESSSTSAAIETGRSRRVRRRLIPVLAVAAVMMGAGLAAWRWRAHAAPPLDPRRYVVLPFRHVGTPGTGRLSGDGCARMLGDAMARWRGVLVTNEMVVNDVWALKRPVTVADAMRAARSLGAGRVAWGTVVTVQDTVEVRAAVYDAGDDETSGQQYAVTIRGANANMDSAFAALADSILVGGRLAEAPVAAVGTTSVDAVRKFLDGREAMGRFDLRTAERRFAEAAALDDGYALAHLWYARTLAWEGAVDPSAWEPVVARAVANGRALPPPERLHAQALLDLATGQMPAACARYRTLIGRDSTDFGAWLGLGDCQARDTLVVRDSRSPTGWSFRGSYHTAIGAYRRALTLVPSFHSVERGAAFERLSNRVLFVEELRRRSGSSAPPEPTRFVAFPSFQAETLAFVPHPYASAGARAAARPASGRQAISWSIGVYKNLMAQWVTAFPVDADAQESYALALEASAGVPGQEGELAAALDHARRARGLTDSTGQRVRLDAAVARLLLKSDDAGGARLVADSTLRLHPSPSPYEAGYLAGLAAMTGRARRTAQLLSIAAAEPEHLPFVAVDGRKASVLPLLASSALSLRGYASLGGPRDSLTTTYIRVQRLIDDRVPGPQRPALRTMLLGWPLGLAYDELVPVARSPVEPGPNVVLEMRSAAARGDTAEARRLSADLLARARRYAIGTTDIDEVYQNALVLRKLGDDSLATRILDDALDALPRSRRILLLVVSQAAAVPRAMVLRAQLAADVGDRAALERWARPAIALWSDADPELRGSVDALRSRLASGR